MTKNEFIQNLNIRLTKMMEEKFPELEDTKSMFIDMLTFCAAESYDLGYKAYADELCKRLTREKQNEI